MDALIVDDILYDFVYGKLKIQKGSKDHSQREEIDLSRQTGPSALDLRLRCTPLERSRDQIVGVACDERNARR